MRTFRTILRLSKPSGRNRIPETTFEYLQTRSRLALFNLVWSELKKSGISQTDLAARLGKGTDRVCKLLAAPGNWTLDTVTELLFAISGGVLAAGVTYPLEQYNFTAKPGPSTNPANSYVAQLERAA